MTRLRLLMRDATFLSWLPLLSFLAASGVALWQAPRNAPPAFAVVSSSNHSPLPAEFEQERLPSVAAFSHASSLTQLTDGRLALAWYAGSHEAAADVEIWFSVRDTEGWSTPKVIAGRPDTAAAVGSAVRTLGNPVLYARGPRLHLWYVAVSAGGWSGSSIHYKHSDDNGLGWSTPERLVTSPFFNLGTLARNPPIPLTDGGVGLPIYHELFVQHAEWLRLGSNGQILGKVRLPSPASAIQPAAAAIDGQHGLALLRNADKRVFATMASVTVDGGASWAQSATLPIGNYNTSPALLRLQSGRLLLAANPMRGRHLLQLFFSDDGGRSWQPGRVIESDADDRSEYSYPALQQGRDGRIHLTYTYQFRAIAYVRLTEAAIIGEKS